MTDWTKIYYFSLLVIFWYFVAINFVNTVILTLGIFKIKRRENEVSLEDCTSILHSESLPKITFIVPAYNESRSIIASIESLRNLTYRYKEIIIVNDGSTDNTLELLKSYFSLVLIPKYFESHLPTQKIRGVYQSEKYKEIFVIDKENGKKFDALNAGINACKTQFFFSIDADTGIDGPSFEKIVRPIFSNTNLIALGATVRVLNGCTLEFNRITTLNFPQRYFPAMQSLEYLRAFIQRQGWDYVGGNVVLSGAFAILNREAVISLGGYANTVAEDMEIILRLHRGFKLAKKPYRLLYLPDPIAWTETPETIKELSRQRKNWHRGTLDCLWFHKRMFLNPRYGLLGLFTFPFWCWGEAIEPLMELGGYVLVIGGIFFGLINIPILILFALLGFVFPIVIAFFCLLIEEISFQKYPHFRSLVYLCFYSLIENFGYRQLTVIWRLKGCWDFIKNYKHVSKTSKDVQELLKKARR